MTSSLRLLAAGALLLGCAASAPAQFWNYNPYAAYYNNPYTMYAQGMNNRAMANSYLMNQQFMNQYAVAAGNYTPSSNYSYGSYGSYPGSMGAPPIGTSPGYDPSMGYPGVLPYNSPYNPYDPYGYGSYGQTLRGAAELNRSQGANALSYEQARLLREQYNQARLDTQKKRFELDMYIKANTPTYTEEQAKVAKLTLRRIQTNSLPGEVTSGKALNYLLSDVAKYPGKKSLVEPILLTEAVLNQLNVTKNTYGIGILRDDGKFSWPTALTEVVGATKRKDMETRVQKLVRDAHREAKFSASVLTDIRAEMEVIRNELVKKVNDIPTGQYLDAKRFLQEFYESTVALERGDAQVQTKYLRFVEGGKSVQDVAEYMIANGLRFAGATASDEGAYQAAHAALASFDVALNTNIGMVAKE